MSEGRRGSKVRVRTRRFTDGQLVRHQDWVATEEPLEIRVMDAVTGDQILAHVTMRTPGHDFELAAGFLLSEGLIRTGSQISEMEYCVGPGNREQQFYNIVSVTVMNPDLGARSGQAFRTAVSACGVCGKASLDEIVLRGIEPIQAVAQYSASVIVTLPDALRVKQALFEATGGLHGAGLATGSGVLIAVREDVGRHNAVDKLLGWSALNHGQSEAGELLVVSGRQSYELAQKAVIGRWPVLAGVSAPSSLAIDLAKQFGLTLIGFVRDGAFNVYSGTQRIVV
jgi:FdhD protein